jgi:hypothetical protein
MEERKIREHILQGGKNLRTTTLRGRKEKKENQRTPTLRGRKKKGKIREHPLYVEERASKNARFSTVTHFTNVLNNPLPQKEKQRTHTLTWQKERARPPEAATRYVSYRVTVRLFPFFLVW